MFSGAATIQGSSGGANGFRPSTALPPPQTQKPIPRPPRPGLHRFPKLPERQTGVQQDLRCQKRGGVSVEKIKEQQLVGLCVFGVGTLSLTTLGMGLQTTGCVLQPPSNAQNQTTRKPKRLDPTTRGSKYLLRMYLDAL